MSKALTTRANPILTASINAADAARYLAMAARRELDGGPQSWEMTQATDALTTVANALGYDLTKRPTPTPVATPEAA